MTWRRLLAVLLWTMLAAAWNVAPVAAREPRLAQAKSVVSILAPGHGSAFAYGRAGQLLTTRSAVGSERSVEVVTLSGEHATTPVLSTSIPEIVALQIALKIGVLASASPSSAEAVVAQDGPLRGSGHRHGRLLSLTTGMTSIAAFPAYDGGPILNSQGAVVGIAEINASRIQLVSLSGLSLATGGGTSLLLVVLLILITLGLAAGGLVFLSSRRSSSATPRPRRSTERQRERAVEQDVDVRLRSRDYTPDPSVELRRPSDGDGREEPDTSDS